ncbi:MAG: diguanylate cyclase, partial [Candidatus Omnitrophota bacterium]
MIYYPISALIIGISSLFLGLFVYLKKRNTPFLLFTISLLVWAFPYYFWQISKTPSEALFWCRSLMAGAIFIPIFYLHFLLQLLDLVKEKIKILVFGYIFFFSCLIFDFTPFFVNRVEPALFFKFWPKPGIAFHPFLIVWMFYFFYIFYLLFKAYRARTGIKRQQIKYVLLGMFLALIAGSTNYLLWYNIPIPPFATILVCLHVIATSYAIIRYRLMDITLAVSQTLVFIILSTITITLHIFIVGFLQLRMGYVLANIISLTILGIILFATPIRNIVSGKINRFVAKDKYNYQKILQDASKALVTILELDNLLNYLFTTIQQSFRVKTITLIMKNDLGNFEVYHSLGLKKDSSQKEYAIKNGLIDWIKNKKQIFIKEEQENLLNKNDFSKLTTELDKFSAEVTVPLFYKSELNGLLTLDRKQSGEPYMQSDLDLLEALANQAAIAIENARLYQEAITDGLTGLYDHKYFTARLKEELERTKRYLHSISLLMIDIDHFKNINDNYGHLKGDEILKLLAKTIKTNTRSSDIVARYGGEEFSVILIETPQEAAYKCAERLRTNVEKNKIQDFSLTIS